MITASIPGEEAGGRAGCAGDGRQVGGGGLAQGMNSLPRWPEAIVGVASGSACALPALLTDMNQVLASSADTPLKFAVMQFLTARPRNPPVRRDVALCV